MNLHPLNLGVPLHPCKYPSRGGGVEEKGGEENYLPQGASERIPNPPPLKNAIWPEIGGGEGRGWYIISPWITFQGGSGTEPEPGTGTVGTVFLRVTEKGG